jgi:hypothetical protein
MLDHNTRNNINFVENNFPKSDLDESSYIENLIRDIKSINIKVKK